MADPFPQWNRSRGVRGGDVRLFDRSPIGDLLRSEYGLRSDGDGNPEGFIRLKRWNGAEWVAHALKRWNGTAWVEHQARGWTGTDWFPALPDVGEPGVANYANAGGSGVDTINTSLMAFTSQATGSKFAIYITYNAPAVAPELVTDSYDNVYVLKTSRTAVVGMWEYVCEDGVGGPNHFAVVDLPHSDYPSLHFVEMVGMAAVAYDAAVSSTGSDYGTPFTQTSGTPSQPNEIILSYFNTDGSGGVDIFAETSGFTLLGQVNNSSEVWPSALAFKVVSSTAQVTSAWTSDNEDATNTTQIMSGFKIA